MDGERDWIRRIKRGDTQPFQDLYRKHYQKLYGLCFRFTGNAGDAEDQLQEVFMKLLDKIDGYRGDASFATWAHRLAVNHLLNFKRGNKHHQQQLPLTDSDLERVRESDPDLAMILGKAVSELPDGFRSVFVLHDQEGFRHDEIAAILGCSAATSRSQLSRARLALRKTLQPLVAKERTA